MKKMTKQRLIEMFYSKQIVVLPKEMKKESSSLRKELADLWKIQRKQLPFIIDIDDLE